MVFPFCFSQQLDGCSMSHHPGLALCGHGQAFKNWASLGSLHHSSHPSFVWMHSCPAAILGTTEIFPKVELNLMSNRLISKMGAEKAGSPVIPVQGGSHPSLEEKGNPLRWMG